MAPPLRLGVIGLSEGNGHPYSWSAIFNGYDQDAMASCPFPVIPAYLAARSFPYDFLPDLGHVTHVWTQDRATSESIAAASFVDHVVDEPEAMLGRVDAVLLARDDAKEHLRLARPFLEAGTPIYVDKPLALNRSDACQLLQLQRWEGQLFSCSALRYAPELSPLASALPSLGPLSVIEGVAPRCWDRYAVHVLEPIVSLLARCGLFRLRIRRHARTSTGQVRRLDVSLDEGPTLSVTTTGDERSPISLRVHGDLGSERLEFRDAFAAFRSALRAFVTSVRTREIPIPRQETLSVVELISLGRP